MNHETAMQRALALGMQGRLTAPPNPWVGCVIVKNGHIIGEGFSQPAGQDHAEVVALKQASHQAKGATVYVTLEPCSHFGKTPPCVNALIQAGITQVFIAVEDPDKRVNGNGIRALRQAGIEVHTGLLQEKAAESLKPYLFQRHHGRPFCIGKAGISLDGRVAAKDGSSQWITCPEARQDAHHLRAESQAILIGSGTALGDFPQLTARHVDSLSKQPLRVILDSKGKVTSGLLLDVSLAPTLILTTDNCSKSSREVWKKSGVEFEVIPTVNNGIDLSQALNLLGKRGILQLLVEGGSQVLGNLFKNDLLNQLTLYLGSIILGANGKPVFGDYSVDSLQHGKTLISKAVKPVGSNVRLDYDVEIPK